jgi:hypothetical protein
MLFVRNRQALDQTNREVAIAYLATANKVEYEKVLKIAGVKRKAYQEIAIIEAGSKKAYEEAQKDDDQFVDFENELGGNNE